MSQKKFNTYINIASFKLNKISLLNQSIFNPFIENKNINSNMNMLFQKKNNNITKVNPLSKKNKIIKKHNILQKIDFYLKANKTNISSNDIINKKNNLKITKLSNNNNKIISPKNILTNKKIRLPFLTFNNYNQLILNKNQNQNQNKKNIINLQKNPQKKNISSAFIFNTFSTENFLDYNNYTHRVDENFDKKRRQNLNILRPNYTDKEIQTCDDVSINIENNEKNNFYKINKSKGNLYSNNNEKNDDSSNDLDYNNEIEKIMKNKLDIRNIQAISNIIYNHKNNKIGKYNNYVLIKSLYTIKNSKKKFNKNNIKKITYYKSDKINSSKDNTDKNLNLHNINKIRKNMSQRQRLMNIKRYQKLIPKTYLYNLITSNHESKIQNFVRSLNN